MVGKQIGHRAGRARERPGNTLGPRHGSQACIAREQLVATVTGERHRDVLPGEPRDDVRGDGGGVAERLVVRVHQLVQQRERVGLDHKLRVLRAETLCGHPGVAGLVVCGVVCEPERKGVHRLRHDLAHEAHHHRGVDASREESAQRHVGRQSHSHRFARGLPHPLLGIGVRYGTRGKIGSPIAPLAVAPVGLQYTRGRRWHPLDSPVESTRGRHVAVRQV